MSGIPGLNTAILDFCTRLDDGPRGDSTAEGIPPRDPADYAWLKEVLANIEQPEHRLKKLIHTCLVEHAVSGAELHEGLEELSDMVEDLNWATEFHLMQGPENTLRQIRSSKDPEERRLLAMIVANASQNHQKLQDAYLKLKVHDVLIPLLAQEISNGPRAALVLAISCVCRGYPPGAKSFLSAGGLGALLVVITGHSCTDPKSSARCLRFAGYLAEEMATTAVPVADAATMLVSSAPVDVDSSPTPHSPALAVSDAAADCARGVVVRAVAAGEVGRQLLERVIGQLEPWVKRGGADQSEDHKQLHAAYRMGVETLRDGGKGSSNKPTAESLAGPTVALSEDGTNTSQPNGGPLLLGQ